MTILPGYLDDQFCPISECFQPALNQFFEKIKRVEYSNELFFRRVADNIQRPAFGFIVQAADVFAEDAQ
jgi:hypothetical protein